MFATSAVRPSNRVRLVRYVRGVGPPVRIDRREAARRRPCRDCGDDALEKFATIYIERVSEARRPICGFSRPR